MKLLTYKYVKLQSAAISQSASKPLIILMSYKLIRYSDILDTEVQEHKSKSNLKHKLNFGQNPRCKFLHNSYALLMTYGWFVCLRVFCVKLFSL